jgi:hypothetical protein
MKKLSFSRNWNNKLDADCFTTLRLSGRFDIGDLVDIDLNGKPKGLAKVLDKKRLSNIEAINDWVAYLDTGSNAAKTKEIIKRMHIKVADWVYQPIYYYLMGYVNKLK